MKTGRNDPCPCGSGKKSKRCHGASRLATVPTPKKAALLAGGLPEAATSTRIDLNGIAGVHSYLIVQPVPPEGPPPGGPGGAPGLYRVVFTLSRPGFSPVADRAFLFEGGLEGDSHLAISPPAYTPPVGESYTQILLRASTSDGSFVFHGVPNKKGFLGKLRLDEIHANDFKNAEMRAFRALSSGLSNISVYLDIPLHLYQVDVTELRTQTSSMSLITPFVETPLYAIPTEGMSTDFRLYASLYREAVNSNSPSYQFLCYFKIIEGVRKRHGRRTAEAKAQRLPIPSTPRDYVPDTPGDQQAWLASLFPVNQKWDEFALTEIFRSTAIGRKVNEVVDKELYEIRLRIAHAVLRSGEPTALIDDGHDRILINEWLPLTKCIARALLRNEFPDVFRR
jgi:hypothetical protein